MGQAIREARIGKTQQELADEIHVDRSTIGKYETGKRSIPEELRSELAVSLDHPLVYFAAGEEATNGVSIPYLDGDMLDRSLASMKEFMLQQVKEALDEMSEAHFFKPARYWTDSERGQMRSAIYELLDAAAALQNFSSIACLEYGFSPRDIFVGWRHHLKQNGWVK